MRNGFAALVCALVAQTALAQTSVRSFDLERLTLNPGAAQSLLLHTGENLNHGQLRLSLALQYQKDPLVYFVDGQRVGAVVGSRISTHLGLAYGITDSIELALQLPVVLSQSGDDLSGQGVAPISGAGLGAPSIQGSFVLLSQAQGSPLDLGLVAGLTLPVGSNSGLARDPGTGLSFLPKLGLGRSFGSMIRIGAEVGAVIRQSGVLSSFAQSTTDEIGSIVTLGLMASTLGDGLRGELTLRGLVPLTKTATAMELLAGARLPLAHHTVELFAAAGPGFGKMPGIPTFRALGGVAWTPDFAPACVEGKPYALAACPALDLDRDGVANAKDSCPEAAGLSALQGCPDKDDDGDGVMNLADRCPSQKGVGGDGCPALVDSDGDGIADVSDACPKEAGVSAQRGCPEPAKPAPEVIADADGDGVVDRADNCPAIKGDAENHGCPAGQQQLVAIEGSRISIKDKIYFATGKAEVLQKSFPILEQVAELLRQHPELTKIQINGHTDDRGAPEMNMNLSRDRAEAVRLFLVNRGIAATRLTAKGFGVTQPIAPNTTAAGREQNRRVEFMSVDN